MTGIITLTAAGLDTGPFDIYSDVDGYVTPFENLIDKAVLLAGYPVDTIPLGTQSVRIQSINSNCTNYVEIEL
jgi:hypothetical protein